MLTTLGAATTAFVVTNLDSLVVLTALFTVRSARPGPIVVGQYLGLAALVAASGAAALGLIAVPTRWTGLLGVIPVALGIRGLRTPHHRTDPPLQITVWTVATLMIANGADNVSVYTPLFRRIGLVQSLSYAAVFAVLAAVWCAAASLLANHKLIVAVVERWEAVIIPAIFIIVGTALILSTLAA
jgi:cadmium resistance protein CadD (predicted permease)